jgi:hypothetical protein
MGVPGSINVKKITVTIERRMITGQSQRRKMGLERFIVCFVSLSIGVVVDAS